LLVFLIATVSATAADWEPLGPFGGSAAIVQMDYQQGVVLAATSNAQLFKSSDDGDSWVSLPFPARSRARLHALAIDRQNPGVYFVGLSGDASEYSGIMRTADGGLTWNRIPEPGLKNVWSIAIWPEDSQVIAAGTEEGLWLTEDGGANWALTTPVDDPELKPVVSIAFDPWDSQTLYLGTPHLAWKTTDGGSAWQPIHEGMINDSDVFYYWQTTRYGTKYLRPLAAASTAAWTAASSGQNSGRRRGRPIACITLPKTPCARMSCWQAPRSAW
jgi:photosystem II stability/assembly factor-like uncharacterized protein